MDWVSMIAEVSFPILVTFYLLSRIENRLEQLSRTIEELSSHVSMDNRLTIKSSRSSS